MLGSDGTTYYWQHFYQDKYFANRRLDAAPNGKGAATPFNGERAADEHPGVPRNTKKKVMFDDIGATSDLHCNQDNSFANRRLCAAPHSTGAATPSNGKRAANERLGVPRNTRTTVILSDVVIDPHGTGAATTSNGIRAADEHSGVSRKNIRLTVMLPDIVSAGDKEINDRATIVERAEAIICGGDNDSVQSCRQELTNARFLTHIAATKLYELDSAEAATAQKLRSVRRSYQLPEKIAEVTTQERRSGRNGVEEQLRATMLRLRDQRLQRDAECTRAAVREMVARENLQTADAAFLFNLQARIGRCNQATFGTSQDRVTASVIDGINGRLVQAQVEAEAARVAHDSAIADYGLVAADADASSWGRRRATAARAQLAKADNLDQQRDEHAALLGAMRAVAETSLDDAPVGTRRAHVAAARTRPAEAIGTSSSSTHESDHTPYEARCGRCAQRSPRASSRCAGCAASTDVDTRAAEDGASMRIENGGLVILGEDDMRLFIDQGQKKVPAGPDGRPTRRATGPDDWVLLERRRASVNEPAPKLSTDSERTAGPATPDGEERRKTTPPEFQHKGNQRLKRNNVQQRTPHRHKPTKTADRQSPKEVEKSTADLQLQNAVTQQDDGASDKPATTVQMFAASVHGKAAAGGATNTDTRPRIMIDTAATVTFLQRPPGAEWSATMQGRSITATDAQGGSMAAHGGGPWRPQIMDENGVVTEELVSDEAFVAATLDGDLGSFPAGRRIGWGLHVDAGDDPAAYLIAADGRRFPLEIDDLGHLWLRHGTSTATQGHAEPVTRPESKRTVQSKAKLAAAAELATTLASRVAAKAAYRRAKKNRSKARQLDSAEAHTSAPAQEHRTAEAPIMAPARELRLVEAPTPAPAPEPRSADMAPAPESRTAEAPIMAPALEPPTAEAPSAASAPEVGPAEAHILATAPEPGSDEAHPTAPAQPATATTTKASQAKQGTIRHTGTGRAGGGAATPAQWPSNMAPIDDDAASSYSTQKEAGLDKSYDTADEISLRQALAESTLQWKYNNYRATFAAWNHDGSAVDKALKLGLLPQCIRPPDFSSAARERARKGGAHWSRTTKKNDSATAVPPYMEVEVDLWGPLDIASRHGHRYMFGGVCRSSGKAFMQPLSKKSDAKDAMRKYFALVQSQCASIQQHLRLTVRGKDMRVTGIATVHSDRAGEFTTTFGYTRSEFDELLTDVWHSLNTPDTPESGTTRIERLWGTLSEAARASLNESGLGKQYFFDAMVYASDVRNMLPTSANKLGGGEAPDATLGLSYDLRTIVPFGSFGYHHTKGKKVDYETDLVILLGFNHEGPGYRALRVHDGLVFTSVHIRAAPGIAGMKEAIEAAKKNPSTASEFVKANFNIFEDQWDLLGTRSGLLRELSAPEPEGAPTVQPRVQVVGDAPGNGGSRVSLKPRAPPPANHVSAKPSIMDRATAGRVIREARAAGQVLRWKQDFKKNGMSNERLGFQKMTNTFGQYDTLKKEVYTSGMSGKVERKVKSDDMMNDVARGIVWFEDADTPIFVPPAELHTVAVPDDAGDDDNSKLVFDIKSTGQQANTEHDDVDDEATENLSADMPSTWAGRLRGHTPRAAAATFPHETRNAFVDKVIAARSAYVDVPDMLVRAAVTRNIRIPRNLADAQASPEWPRWKAAIEKEIGGLIRLGVYNEVNRNDATTKVVPTQMIFDIKLDGSFKCRFVVRGDLTTKGEHYLETRSSMVSMEAVRTVLALAAGNDWALTTTDFSQAYCHAKEDNKSLFCELPTLPDELHNSDFGEGFTGKRTGKVAHMQRNLLRLTSRRTSLVSTSIYSPYRHIRRR